MIRHFGTILAALVFVSCADPENILLEAQSQFIEARVSLEPTASPFSEDNIKLQGVLTVLNRTDAPQRFSNRWLWLDDGHGLKSRAYVDSVASQLMDVGTIVLEPEEELTVPIYWVFTEAERGELELDSFVLQIRQGE